MDPRDRIPQPARAAARAAWDRLPPARRRDVEQWLPGAARSLGGMKDLFAWIGENYRTALSEPTATIAIVGPANVGKSTLYNCLIADKQDRAAVSPVPGTTRANQAGSAGLFTIVDTPGADAAGAVGEQERQIAFGAAAAADFLVIVFDAPHGVRRADRALFDELHALGKPFVVVLNKMDLVGRRDRAAVLASAAANLGLDALQVIDVVATRGTNVGQVVLAIAQADPGLLLALADALPAYRARLAWQRVISAATASASVAFIPLPMADVIPLLGLQTGMVLTVARIYGFDITPARAKELIATFGLGLAARTLYRELSKLLGAPGWVISAAVAASTTVGMGYAAMMWFERGEKPTREAVARVMREAGLYLREQLASLRGRRPGRAGLRKAVGDALAGLPERLRRDAGD